MLKSKTRPQMALLIRQSLPPYFYNIVRIHVGGDFFNENYFHAWCDVARQEPDRLFYTYTKSLPFWVQNRSKVPDNLVLTASRGGKFDDLILPHGLKNERVIGHPEEADMLGLEIDHNDNLARDPDVWAFALLIHGVQPAGSMPSKAQKRMRLENITYSYSRKRAGNTGDAGMGSTP